MPPPPLGYSLITIPNLSTPQLLPLSLSSSLHGHQTLLPFSRPRRNLIRCHFPNNDDDGIRFKSITSNPNSPMTNTTGWQRWKKALGQRLNPAGVFWFANVAIRDPQLAIPHLSVPDIRWINWDALKKAGFRGVVFDKDNTLTEPYSLALWPSLEDSFHRCRSAFPGRIAILSNSAGLDEYDPDGSHAKAIEESLEGVHVIRHGTKKPAGSAKEIEKFVGYSASNIVLVGDRYFTDIVYGNRNGFLTIYSGPLSYYGEPFIVQQRQFAKKQQLHFVSPINVSSDNNTNKRQGIGCTASLWIKNFTLVRKWETYLVNSWYRKGIIPSKHFLMSGIYQFISSSPS